MKIITLTQPWATLVAVGVKRIETRSWSTNYRGPIAIHAAQGFPSYARRLAANSEPFRGLLAGVGLTVDTLPTGAIVAVAELVSVREMRSVDGRYPGWRWTGPDGRHYDYPVTAQELALGAWSDGRHAWLLSDVRPLRDPIAYKGALGLRALPADVVARVRAGAVVADNGWTAEEEAALVELAKAWGLFDEEAALAKTKENK